MHLEPSDAETSSVLWLLHHGALGMTNPNWVRAARGDFHGMLSPREETCPPDEALGDLLQYQEMLLTLRLIVIISKCLKHWPGQNLGGGKPPPSQTFPFQSALAQKTSRT